MTYCCVCGVENTTKEFISSRVLPWEYNNGKKKYIIKPRGSVYEVWKCQDSENRTVLILCNCDVNRCLQTLVLNSDRLTIDMTTGKLNCVSKQHRPSPAKPGGNFRCDGMTARLCFSSPKPNLCPILMFEARRKQSYGSTGMACEGRARNRMLRKRQIVRNPCYAVDIGTVV